MPIIEPSTSNAPVIEDGLYIVTCRGVDAKTIENDQFGKNKKLEFHLAISTLDGVPLEDEEGEPVQIDPLINQAWSEKATLFKYAIGFGIEAHPDEPIDTDIFQGKKAKALISTEKEGAWPKVKELLPLGKTKTPANGAKPSQTAPAPSQAPSLINDKGEVDLPEFWKACFAVGIKRNEVIEAVGGDVENLTTMEPTEVVALYEILAAGKTDTPFEG